MTAVVFSSAQSKGLQDWEACDGHAKRPYNTPSGTGGVFLSSRTSRTSPARGTCSPFSSPFVARLIFVLHECVCVANIESTSTAELREVSPGSVILDQELSLSLLRQFEAHHHFQLYHRCDGESSDGTLSLVEKIFCPETISATRTERFSVSPSS